jgi:hypothetical protein
MTGLHVTSLVVFDSYFDLFEKFGICFDLNILHIHTSLDSCIVNRGDWESYIQGKRKSVLLE